MLERANLAPKELEKHILEHAIATAAILVQDGRVENGTRFELSLLPPLDFPHHSEAIDLTKTFQNMASGAEVHGLPVVMFVLFSLTSNSFASLSYVRLFMSSY